MEVNNPGCHPPRSGDGNWLAVSQDTRGSNPLSVLVQVKNATPLLGGSVLTWGGFGASIVDWEPTLMECFVNSLFKYSYMNRDASTPCSGNALRAHFYQPFGETRGGPKLTTWGISKHGNKEVGLGNPQCDHLSANNIWWPFND